MTNCDALKAWLQSEGHAVRSDNDGEMVVHTIEHCFSLAMASVPESKKNDAETRRAAMRQAVCQAIGKIEGSFAAVIVDPVSRTLFAVARITWCLRRWGPWPFSKTIPRGGWR